MKRKGMLWLDGYHETDPLCGIPLDGAGVPEWTGAVSFWEVMRSEKMADFYGFSAGALIVVWLARLFG